MWGETLEKKQGIVKGHVIRTVGGGLGKRLAS